MKMIPNERKTVAEIRNGDETLVRYDIVCHGNASFRVWLGNSCVDKIFDTEKEAADYAVSCVDSKIYFYYPQYPDAEVIKLGVPEGKKTERLYIRLTPELKEQLQKAAEKENRTVTNYIENLIKQAMKK